MGFFLRLGSESNKFAVSRGPHRFAKKKAGFADTDYSDSYLVHDLTP